MIRDSSQSRRSRRILFNGLVLLVATVVSLLGAEGLVRLVAPQQLIIKRPDIWRPDDELGWVHRAGVSTTVNTGERTVRFITDSLGFRVGREGRPESETDILVLGDSFMEALQVEYRNSVPGLLQRRLPERLRRPVSVYNAAVGAWEPSHYLLQARRVLQRPIEFDLALVFLYVANDVPTSRQSEFAPRPPEETHNLRLPKGVSWGELVDAVLYPINDLLETRSHLYVLLKNRLDVLRMRLGLTAAYFPDVFRRSERDSDRWRVTASICADISSIFAKRDVPTLFVLLPNQLQVDRTRLRSYLKGFDIPSDSVSVEQPNRLLTERLEKHGVRYVDLLSSFRQAHRAEKQLYGRVDPHLSPTGHDVVFREIHPFVTSLLSGR